MRLLKLTLLFVLLLATNALAQYGAGCVKTEWYEPVHPCLVSYEECPPTSGKPVYTFRVTKAGGDLGIRFRVGVPFRCWLQAVRRWGCFIEACRGEHGFNCPTFPYDGCGQWVIR